MDGNGRWAKKRLMPRSFGHKQGMERMIGLMERAFDLGVPYITVYALSTENLRRPQEELNGLYDLIRKHFEGYMERLCQKGVRLRVIGETQLLPEDVQEILLRSQKKTEGYEGKGINVVDLGVDVEPQAFVQAAIDNNAKLICCSSLLTTTMPAMGDVVKAAEAAGIRGNVKIMVGGAPVTQEFADSIGADCYTSDAASAAMAAAEYLKA